MATPNNLEGHFATERMRRLEHRFQRAGVCVLVAVIGSALAGLLSTPFVVARAAAVYAFLLVVFRVAGHRSMAQVTTFDLILVLIIGDATQQALVGDDYRISTGLVVVSTLVVIDIALGRAKQHWPAVDAVLDGLPLPLIVAGSARRNQMAGEGVTMDDVLTAARAHHGLSRMDQVEHAVLEQDGGISIVPAQPSQR
jgi:uncharacterized membrane protein YcaP (DUF421 family)